MDNASILKWVRISLGATAVVASVSFAVGQWIATGRVAGDLHAQIAVVGTNVTNNTEQLKEVRADIRELRNDIYRQGERITRLEERFQLPESIPQGDSE